VSRIAATPNATKVRKGPVAARAGRAESGSSLQVGEAHRADAEADIQQEMLVEAWPPDVIRNASCWRNA